jgi:hypothetical protein
MADIRKDQIGVWGEVFRRGGTGQHRDPQHPRHPRGLQIVNAVPNHRDRGRGKVHMGGKGVQLPRRRFAPMAAVKSCDKVEHIDHPRRQQMGPRGVFGIVRRHAKAQAPVAEPLQKRS